MEYVSFGDDGGYSAKINAIWAKHAKSVSSQGVARYRNHFKGTYEQDLQKLMAIVTANASVVARKYANIESGTYQTALMSAMAAISAFFDKYRIGTPGSPERFNAFKEKDPANASKLAQLMDTFVKVGMVSVVDTLTEAHEAAAKVIIPTAGMFVKDPVVAKQIADAVTAPIRKPAPVTSGGTPGGTPGPTGGVTGEETKSNTGLLIGAGVAALAAFLAFRG